MRLGRINKTVMGMLAVATVALLLPNCKKQVTVSLAPATIEIKVGETGTVTATVTRDGNPEANLTVAFETADQNVATVSPPSANTSADGEAQATVQGESPGSTTVTATAEGQSASAEVTVSEPQPCVTHTVVLRNFAFNPAALTIDACDVVTWEHQQGNIPHTVTSGNVGDSDAGALFDSRAGEPDARMREPDTFSHVFQDAGTFPYHCVVHGGGSMTGTITVNPNP